MRRTDGLIICAIATYNKGDIEVLRLFAAWKTHGVDFFLSLSYTLLTGAHQRQVNERGVFLNSYDIIELFRVEMKNNVFNSSLDEAAQNEILEYIDDVAKLVTDTVSSSKQ